ncbi:protein of unknown function [Legionella fallonii LLAP-10]|uniref:Uncharacterized protein n=1 Tax=Legionella fallonii LLAP-10 TaxID=1212491 RepID=A0A098G730_9GAMM|nr:protein of unknown function [Legionella fallonii LLAP-10]
MFNFQRYSIEFLHGISPGLKGLPTPIGIKIPIGFAKANITDTVVDLPDC